MHGLGPPCLPGLTCPAIRLRAVGLAFLQADDVRHHPQEKTQSSCEARSSTARKPRTRVCNFRGFCTKGPLAHQHAQETASQTAEISKSNVGLSTYFCRWIDIYPTSPISSVDLLLQNQTLAAKPPNSQIPSPPKHTTAALAARKPSSNSYGNPD